MSEPLNNDPEIAALIARLEATAPRAIIDPVFREALREKLLDILAHWEKTTTPNEGETPIEHP